MSPLPPGTQHRAGGSRYSCLVGAWPPSSTLSTAKEGSQPLLYVHPLLRTGPVRGALELCLALIPCSLLPPTLSLLWFPGEGQHRLSMSRRAGKWQSLVIYNPVLF